MYEKEPAPETFSLDDHFIINQLIDSALNMQSEFTKQHCRKVAEYAVRLGQKAGLNAQRLELLKISALLHDIGKVYIGPKLINKTGRLTPEDRKIIEDHAIIGPKLIKKSKYFKMLSLTGQKTVEQYILDPVGNHHLFWKGHRGYGTKPHLKQLDIPLFARIISVVDAFDAMTTKRPYHKKEIDLKEALDELTICSNSQFDPKLVNLFQSTHQIGG